MVTWNQLLPVMRGYLPFKNHVCFVLVLKNIWYLLMRCTLYFLFLISAMYASCLCFLRCLAVSPNFEIAKNNMAIALTDLGTKVVFETIAGAKNNHHLVTC